MRIASTWATSLLFVKPTTPCRPAGFQQLPIFAMSDKLRHRTQPAPRGALSNRSLFVFGAVAAAIAHFATSLV